MLKFGTTPFLECSSKGDKRFSAFYARVRLYDNKSIEEIYQTSKVFEQREVNVPWTDNKGRWCSNGIETAALYRKLWRVYISENPELVRTLLSYNGFSDVFGQAGHKCQAFELYLIRKRLSTIPDIEQWIHQRKVYRPNVRKTSLRVWEE